MKRLWAPWRVTYIRVGKTKGCIFCDKPAEQKDDDNHIVYRGKDNFVMLNLYPYNPGHLLVAPYRHAATLEDLTDAELLEHFDVVRKCTRALRETLTPHGFNIGINQGAVAGAGVEGHVHTHIVPRWNGDTNFMPVLGDVKVVSEGLASTYAQLVGKIGKG